MTHTDTPARSRTTTMRGRGPGRLRRPGRGPAVAEVPRPALPDDGVLVRVRAASIHVGTVVHRAWATPGSCGPCSRSSSATTASIGLDTWPAPSRPSGRTSPTWRSATRSSAGAAARSRSTPSRRGDRLVPKPANLTFEQAAALGVSAFTALQALRDHGRPAGGPARARHRGVRRCRHVRRADRQGDGRQVTGVCSTRNVDLVRSIGADHVIDYTRQDWTERSRRATTSSWTTSAPTRCATCGACSGRDGLLLANGGPAPTGWFGGMGRPLKVMAASLFSRQQGRPFLSTENAGGSAHAAGAGRGGADHARRRSGVPAAGRRRGRRRRRRGPQPGHDRHRHVTDHDDARRSRPCVDTRDHESDDDRTSHDDTTGAPRRRGPRPHQGLRRPHRRRRRVVHRRGGRDLRDPRPERCRQDHHRRVDRRAADARRGHGPRLRARPGRRPDGGPRRCSACSCRRAASRTS